MKNIVRIDFKKAELIQDLNCDALASIKAEHKLLNAISEVLTCLDRRDGILGNEPMIDHCRKILAQAIEANHYQHSKDDGERIVLDKVIPLFPERSKLRFA